MNAGFIKRIMASIAATKQELTDKKAGQPDRQMSQEEEDKLLDQLGMFIELLEQFEQG